MKVIHVLSRSLAATVAVTVSLGGLLPTPHAHLDRTEAIVHTHEVVDLAHSHHDAGGDHRDATFDHDGHAAAVDLRPSYNIATRFVLAAVIVSDAFSVTTQAVGEVCGFTGTTLLPTHDPPLRFTSSPAPPAVV